MFAALGACVRTGVSWGMRNLAKPVIQDCRQEICSLSGLASVSCPAEQPRATGDLHTRLLQFSGDLSNCEKYPRPLAQRSKPRFAHKPSLAPPTFLRQCAVDGRGRALPPVNWSTALSCTCVRGAGSGDISQTLALCLSVANGQEQAARAVLEEEWG